MQLFTAMLDLLRRDTGNFAEFLDPCMVLRRKFMQRRVNKTYRHGETVHGLENTVKIIPLKRQKLDDESAAVSLHALFTTGFFKDVELKVEQGVLVVVVKERPTVASVEIEGVKDFPKDQLKESLKAVGLGEGLIFDKSALEKSENEMKRQYIARGKYSVVVKTSMRLPSIVEPTTYGYIPAPWTRLVLRSR